MPNEEIFVEAAVKEYGIIPNDGKLSLTMGELKECMFQLIRALRSKNPQPGAQVFKALTVFLYGALKANNENELSKFCSSSGHSELSPVIWKLNRLSQDMACRLVLTEMQQSFSGQCYAMVLDNKINIERTRKLLFSKNRSRSMAPEEISQFDVALEKAKEKIAETEQFCMKYSLNS